MNPVLEEMFATGIVKDKSGRAHEFSDGLSREQAQLLEEMCRSERPTTTLEVGLAYGSSAIAILEGKDQREGIHYAVDPFQSSQWSAIGVENIRRAGFEKQFTLLEDYDDLALPRLVSEGVRVDFAFIDGDHSLSAAWLDWHYVDQLLVDGASLVFHDYPLGGVYLAVVTALGTGRYEHVTHYEIRRPWPRRLGGSAIELVHSRNIVMTFARGAAKTHMAVLRKRASAADVGDRSRP